MRSVAPLLVLVALLYTRASAVCSAPQPRLVCAEYFASQAVVEAKLVGSEYIAPANDIDGHVYHLKTEKTLRGNTGPTFDVWDENSSGRTTFDWTSGHSYLLFLLRKGDRGWVVDGCGNSGPLESAATALKQVQEIPSEHQGMIQVAVGGDWLAWSPPVAGLLTKAQGPGGTYSATTNRKGVAEIHVSAGKYSVTVPDRTVLPFDFSYDDPGKVVVENGGCAQIQFVEPQGTH